MGEIKLPSKVCLIISILFGKDESLNNALDGLKRAFGDGIILNFEGEFNQSDYYNKELGDSIMRRFWKANELFERDRLADIKLITNGIEREFLLDNKRTFNLDPGFLSLENFILATTKNYTHRIYLRDGIYADLTLIYSDKEFRPLEWTYPDYAGSEIRKLLKKEREEYLKRLNEG